MNKNAILYFLLSAIAISSNYIVNRAGLKQGLDPVSFALTSGVIAAIFSSIYIIPKTRELKMFSRPEWLNLIILGVIASGTSALTRFWGLSLTTAVNASLLSRSNILFTVPIAYIMLNERISKMAWLSVFIILSGCFILSTGGALITPQTGDLIIIFSALQVAFANCLAKKVMIRIPAGTVSMLRLIIGAIFMLISVPIFMGPSAFSSLFDGFWYVIVSGVLTVTYVFGLYRGIGLSNASIGNTFHQFHAVLTVILAYVFLGESLSPIKGLGGLLILVGAYLISKERDN